MQSSFRFRFQFNSSFIHLCSMLVFTLPGSIPFIYLSLSPCVFHLPSFPPSLSPSPSGNPPFLPFCWSLSSSLLFLWPSDVNVKTGVRSASFRAYQRLRNSFSDQSILSPVIYQNDNLCISALEHHSPRRNCTG